MTAWYSTFTPTYEDKMDVNFYYRSKDGKLHAIAVADADDFNDAKQAALGFLAEDGEPFLLPLLGLIKGGKA